MANKDIVLENLKKKLLSIEETSFVLGTSDTTVRGLVKKGDIKYLKLGNTYKIYEFELDNFIQEHLGKELITATLEWVNIE